MVKRSRLQSHEARERPDSQPDHDEQQPPSPERFFSRRGWLARWELLDRL
jgi:hypothetical protein